MGYYWIIMWTSLDDQEEFFLKVVFFSTLHSIEKLHLIVMVVKVLWVFFFFLHSFRTLSAYLWCGSSFHIGLIMISNLISFNGLILVISLYLLFAYDSWNWRYTCELNLCHTYFQVAYKCAKCCKREIRELWKHLSEDRGGKSFSNAISRDVKANQESGAAH